MRIEPKSRMRRMEEAIEIMRLTSSREHADYEGQYYKPPNLACPPPPRPPPSPDGGGSKPQQARAEAGQPGQQATRARGRGGEGGGEGPGGGKPAAAPPARPPGGVASAPPRR